VKTSDIIMSVIGIIFIIGVIYGAIKRHKSNEITIFYSYIDFSMAFGISTLGLTYYLFSDKTEKTVTILLFIHFLVAIWQFYICFKSNNSLKNAFLAWIVQMLLTYIFIFVILVIMAFSGAGKRKKYERKITYQKRQRAANAAAMATIFGVIFWLKDSVCRVDGWVLPKNS